MANRPAGGARSKVWPRDGLDWYQEPRWLADQIFAHIDFPNCVVYDPCCGAGTMLDAAKAAGYPTMGSDLVNRGASARHSWARGDARHLGNAPVPAGMRLGIASNPPFGYEEDIAERIIRQTLALPNLKKAVYVVPLAFLSSQGRFSFFARELRPAVVWICSERPTMPPGAQVAAMGSAAFKGAMQDYCVIEYHPMDPPGQSEIKWLRPTGAA
jgi:hypothetical protein